MKTFLLCLTTLLFTGNALAQACWSEWEHDGQWLMRTSCTQNVSIPDTNRLCAPRVRGDEPRSAATCPATARVFGSGSVWVEPMDFRCMGLKPPGAGGAANTFYYGLGKNRDEVEVVRNLCVQFGGKWEGVKSTSTGTAQPHQAPAAHGSHRLPVTLDVARKPPAHGVNAGVGI